MAKKKSTTGSAGQPRDSGPASTAGSDSVSAKAGAKPALPAPVLPPANRRLQIFALDPAADVSLDTAHISRTVIKVPWEGHPCECTHGGDEEIPETRDPCRYGDPVPDLKPGPIGEYVEVVDVDPASGCVYDPINLNDPLLLANDGHDPSIGNPQFHQQMVYAVAMKTIANFERVLGRRILWADRERRLVEKEVDGKLQTVEEFTPPTKRYVQRLRIYPHALREANAYYSPAKKALLFGYFNATTDDPRDDLPGGVVFTCLSYDIIAHETTHAILDGLHRRLMDATNRDMLAFHEAFADIVAIFQHFTVPGMLHDQIQRTRGDLRVNNRLAQLAAQFGYATGRGGALRNAIGATGPDGRAKPADPGEINRTFEPHERGAILVAAVFDAFLRMYENRVADLYRIATGGTGVLPAGEIHPDLARRLADTAAQLAQRVLDICIRTVDYLPPVDVNFGDFLRGLITADSDFHPDDPRRFRLAFIDAFRHRGIVPRDIRALGEEGLHWNRIDCDCWDLLKGFLPPKNVLRTMAYACETPGEVDATGLQREFFEFGDVDRPSADEVQKRLESMSERLLSLWAVPNQPPTEDQLLDHRGSRYRLERCFAVFLHSWITLQTKSGKAPLELKKCVNNELGLDLDALAVPRKGDGGARLEVHAVRPTIRLRSDGRSKVELLVLLTQSRRVDMLDENGEPVKGPDDQTLKIKIRGGCTLIIDPETGRIRYSICKRLPTQAEIEGTLSGDSELQQSPRLARQMEFVRSQLGGDRQAAIARFGLTPDAAGRQIIAEPFAVVHQSEPEHAGY